MLNETLITQLALDYENRIIVVDADKLLKKSSTLSQVVGKGFEVYEYKDPFAFRCYYEKQLRDNQATKILLYVSEPGIYIPYDIRKRFYIVNLDYSTLFPKFDTYTLRRERIADLDLLNIAYQNYFGRELGPKQTKVFLKNGLFSEENLKEYLNQLSKKLRILLESINGYKSWFEIALIWARINSLLNLGFVQTDFAKLGKELNDTFKNWMLTYYKELSANSIVSGPVLVNRINDYIKFKRQKAALIVVDGMSVENWLTLIANSEQFDYDIDLSFVFAIVPTITSISRKTIFSGKLPINHNHIFSLTDEEREWRAYWKNNGYNETDIFWGRGVNVEIPYNTRIAGIVINTIDDLMHGQILGSEGMSRDIAHLARKGDVAKLVDVLVRLKFNVFITSDHGNIAGIGIGKPQNEGLLTEITSQRVRVYQSYANTEGFTTSQDIFEYPGFYLPKEFHYLICDQNFAFSTKGETVQCHGGMNIEEVIVPFIQIKEWKNE